MKILNMVRFKNRKLYGEKKYLNLKDVVREIAKGRDIKVVRQINRKEDVTVSTLIRILIELKDYIDKKDIFQTVKKGARRYVKSNSKSVSKKRRK